MVVVAFARIDDGHSHRQGRAAFARADLQQSAAAQEPARSGTVFSVFVVVFLEKCSKNRIAIVYCTIFQLAKEGAPDSSTVVL